MNPLDCQAAYWDGAAANKTFTHPLRIEWLRAFVPPDGTILDYGCGYGRTVAFLAASGYENVVGVDISSAMIRRGRGLSAGLDLRHIKDHVLPFPDHSFAACLLLAVLNCLPTDGGQKALIGELHRVLKPSGILYLSDYPLQPDAKNRQRYDRYKDRFGQYGVFQLTDGAVLRHHDIAWIHRLLDRFDIVGQETMDVLTMNGNRAVIFQIIARKRVQTPRRGSS